MIYLLLGKIMYNFMNTIKVDDLITNICGLTGKSYSTVKNTFIEKNIFPVNKNEKVILNYHNDNILNKEKPIWLENSFKSIFKKYNINSLYIELN